MATTVTSKGQVTIPKPVRDLLGITPGSSVIFELAPDGRVLLARAGAPAAAVKVPRVLARLRGSAGAGLSTDQIMALTRGED